MSSIGMYTTDVEMKEIDSMFESIDPQLNMWHNTKYRNKKTKMCTGEISVKAVVKWDIAPWGKSMISTLSRKYNAYTMVNTRFTNPYGVVFQMVKPIYTIERVIHIKINEAAHPLINEFAWKQYMRELLSKENDYTISDTERERIIGEAQEALTKYWENEVDLEGFKRNVLETISYQIV